MIDRHTLEILDFPRIRELIAEDARTPQGADLCLGLEPHATLEATCAALDELGDLAGLEPILGLPPTEGMCRIEGHLEAARTQGACLEAEALLAARDTLAVCHRVLDYLEDAGAEQSRLGIHARQMRPLYELADRFERTFGPRGEVLDGASPTLLQLRAEMKRIRGRILKTLQAVLRDAHMEPAVQDDFITLRGGRYVIPLRTDFRGYLEGIVHDRSRSGATFFVEPLEVVELNNELGLVREEETAEIRRILTELTAWLGLEASALQANMAVVAHLDALGARLKLARRLTATRPHLIAEPVVELRDARHPLLPTRGRSEVVPVDLRVDGSHRLLLITGANAGGKTVSLKTIGLLVVMARSGLFIPAREGSRLGWFEGLYADIGDEQDIGRQLSTFTAHASHLRDILERSRESSLVLLDELGTGTAPQEGVALAAAALETLLERGALVVGTTHLDGLKAFAYARPDGQNAAVAFEQESGRPLYRLIYGRAGASNALEVAERLGMPREVLERARAYCAGGSSSVSVFLRDIDSAKDAALRAAEESEALRDEWHVRLEEQHALLEEARRERDAARAEARREARALIEDARREFKHTIRAFARREMSQQQAEEALQRAGSAMEAALRPEAREPTTRPPADLAPGTRVSVLSLNRDGTVESVEPNGRKATVRVGKLPVTVPVEELRAARAGDPQSPRPTAPVIRVDAERVAPDVVIVGCTVDEALNRVDKALDRALLIGSDGFRVIHGHGTGALRQSIRAHLAGAPHVLCVRSEGGDAATWVDVE